MNKRVFGGTPKNDFSVEFPYKTSLLVSIQVGLSVVSWVRVGKYKMFVSWVNCVPVIEGDFLVFFVEIPGALDMSAPNFLVTPLGVIRAFTWGFFVKDDL